jgi:DNA-binding transcriptional LysR family regulator
VLSIDDLRFVSALVLCSSMAGAARVLGVTPPAITQRLRLLEGKLGVRLVDRSTRHLRLTDEGQLLVDRGRDLLDQLDELSDDLMARKTSVAGHLRVVAPFGFGRRFIAPVVVSFRAENPKVSVSLNLSENPARLDTDSWDILVHIGELRDSSLILHRLAPNDRVICASPSYVEGHGTPRHPADLKDHECVVLRENDEDATLWRFIDPDGKAYSVRIKPSLCSNDGEVVRRWALAGLGIVIRSEWDVAEDIHAARLVRLLDDYHLASADINALLNARDGRTARTERFLQHLSKVLNPPPWRRGISGHAGEA